MYKNISILLIVTASDRWERGSLVVSEIYGDCFVVPLLAMTISIVGFKITLTYTIFLFFLSREKYGPKFSI